MLEEILNRISFINLVARRVEEIEAVTTPGQQEQAFMVIEVDTPAPLLIEVRLTLL